MRGKGVVHPFLLQTQSRQLLLVFSIPFSSGPFVGERSQCPIFTPRLEAGKGYEGTVVFQSWALTIEDPSVSVGSELHPED